MKYDELTQLKKELDARRPLPDILIRNLEDWFRVELTYTSNALEGNTLSRRETALVIEKGLTVGGKTLIEHIEAKNHAEALDVIYTLAKIKPKQLTEDDLLRVHAIILKNIEDDYAGRYRPIPVRISGSAVVLPNPKKVPDLMHDYMKWLREEKHLHPVGLATEAHYRLVTIHPFIDGNGRTARLIMNLILIMHGYPPAIIRKIERLSYLNALEKAQLGGSRNDFDAQIAASVKRSLVMYLKAAEGETSFEDSDSDRLLKIGELAEGAGVSIPTIRYWTKEGLLEVADKRSSGYQLYAPNMIERCKKIQELKQKRLTLEEIKARF